MTDTVRRDYLIEQAVTAGKFPPERAAHYREQYDRDAAGTERLLAALACVPVGLLGHRDPVEQTLAAGRALLGNRGGINSAPAAAPREPVQAQHIRPVEQPASSVELTPELVSAWSASLFPETRATGAQGRITMDMKYQRGAAA